MPLPDSTDLCICAISERHVVTSSHRRLRLSETEDPDPFGLELEGALQFHSPLLHYSPHSLASRLALTSPRLPRRRSHRIRPNSRVASRPSVRPYVRMWRKSVKQKNSREWAPRPPRRDQPYNLSARSGRCAKHEQLMAARDSLNIHTEHQQLHGCHVWHSGKKNAPTPSFLESVYMDNG